MSSPSVPSQKCDIFLNASLMQNIDEDVEKMNFKLISIENSIRTMLIGKSHSTAKETVGSLFAKHANSRHEVKASASKLLQSRKNQQDKLIRLKLKKTWEQESKLINDVAVPALKLSDKSAALINASRNKMFEKKIELVKLSSALKNMNLQSVTTKQQHQSQWFCLHCVLFL
jgi:hypothetical protein